MQLYESRLIPTKLLVNNTGQIEGVPKNPRIIKTKAYEKLRDSIESDYSHLYTNELKVYPFGDKFVVISGNMRLKACKELKLKEIPCKIIPEMWTAEQICKEAIISNVSSGEWNNEDLANEWDDLPLNSWGLDAPEWPTEEQGQQDNTKIQKIECPTCGNMVDPSNINTETPF